MEDTDDPNGGEEETAPLPEVAQGDILECLGLLPGQHFTQPPPRYSEPTLIKALEQQGIGRPSTYASIMGTIMERDYVSKDRGRFVPTKLGTAVTDLLTAHFPDVMNIGFTARIEEELDEIAHGKQEWVPVLRQFYEPFDKAVERAMKEAERVPRDQILVKAGVKCPGPQLDQCAWDGDIVERRQGGRNGKRFWGCSTFPKCTSTVPKCTFTVNQRPLPEPCPECGKLLVALSRTEAGCTSCKYRGGLPESEPPETAVQPPR
jgi:DNA topoisomerase-1